MLSCDDPTVEMPLDGTLDLHTFRPSEVAEVIPEYVAACAERGVRHLRIIHGKGRGTLRAIVEAVLRRNPLVAAFTPADETAGGWGATLVVLR
jgi:DNA-nicking Smr family endonuclease